MPEEPKDNQKPATPECAPNAAQKPATKHPSMVMTNAFPTLMANDNTPGGWTKVSDDGTTSEWRSNPAGSMILLPLATITRRKFTGASVPPNTVITVRRIADDRWEVLFPYEFKS